MTASYILPPLSLDGRQQTVSGHPVFDGDGQGNAYLEPSILSELTARQYHPKT